MPITKPKDAYSNIANKYDEIYSNYKCQLEDSYIKSILKKNNIHKGTILDLGCGTGTFLDWFGDNPLGYHGIDIAPEMIERAKYKFPEANFKVGDMADIKLYENDCDSIICLFSFSYCLKPEVVIKNCYEKLRNGGNLFIVAYTPKWAYSQSDVTISNGIIVNKLLYTKNFFRLILNGFKIQSIVEFPVFLDLLPQKFHNSKTICKSLFYLDKLFAKFFNNFGAYVIVHAKKLERLTL